MSADFEMILDECLARVADGESVTACLGDYPAQAGELQPLLATALGLRRAAPPRPSEVAVTAGKQKVLAAFGKQPAQLASPQIGQGVLAYLMRILRIGPIPTPAYLLRFALGILIVLALGATSAVAASSRSLPGDALYPVKQAVKSLRFALTFDGRARQGLEAEFASQRLFEIQSLMQLRRQQIVEFEDVLQSVGVDGWWVVGPFAVRVNEATVVAGRPAPGAYLKVQAVIQGDGSLLALRVAEEVIEGGHKSEDRTGAGSLHLDSPTPAAPATHEPGGEPRPEPSSTSVHESEGGSEHPMAPATAMHDEKYPMPEPKHGPGSTAWPTPQVTVVPTHSPDPTRILHDVRPAASPTRHAEPTREPPHASAPTAAPTAIGPAETARPSGHENAATPEPAHHDVAPGSRSDQDSQY